jgi:hypothetical protein
VMGDFKLVSSDFIHVNGNFKLPVGNLFLLKRMMFRRKLAYFQVGGIDNFIVLGGMS